MEYTPLRFLRFLRFTTNSYSCLGSPNKVNLNLTKSVLSCVFEMAAQTDSEPEIVLYDLACVKDVCFSPAVWRIRLMLNYKAIPYKTIFLEFPDIEPTLKDLLVLPVSE